MIAYKLVVEKEGKFYPLVNFGINCWMGDTNFPPYELNKKYVYNGEGLEYVKQKFKLGKINEAEIDGYHFWLEPNKKEQINAILKCEVHKIRWIGIQYYKRPHKKIIAEEFTPLERIL